MNKYNIPVITDLSEIRKNKEGIRKGKLVRFGNYYYRYRFDISKTINILTYGIQLEINKK